MCNDLEQMRAAGLISQSQIDDLKARGLFDKFAPLLKKILTSVVTQILTELPNLLAAGGTGGVPEAAPKK